MIVVQYMWGSRSGDSFSGLHVALFEDREQADMWIESMKGSLLAVTSIVEKDLTAMAFAATQE